MDELEEKDGPYVETVFLDFGAAFIRAALRARQRAGLAGVHR